jgi:hypothetical protein
MSVSMLLRPELGLKNGDDGVGTLLNGDFDSVPPTGTQTVPAGRYTLPDGVTIRAVGVVGRLSDLLREDDGEAFR